MRVSGYCVWLALAAPLFGQLQHSRWNPDVSGIFLCCPTHTYRINVVLQNDISTPLLLGPATYTVYIDGVAQGGTTVNGDGTFSPSDAGKPYQRTVSLGGLGGKDGQYDQDPANLYEFTVNIRVDGPGGTVLTDTITGNNRFVADRRYSIFVPTLITDHYHTPHEFKRDYPVIINGIKPRDRERKPCQTTCSNCGGKPMAEYSLDPLHAGLTIADTPLRYSPPRGPAFTLKLTYDEADPNPLLPASYSNFGPKWSFNWLAFVASGIATTDDEEGVLYRSGRGIDRFKGWSPASFNGLGFANGRDYRSKPDEVDGSVLLAVASPASVLADYYWHELADGGWEEYQHQPAGSVIRFLSKTRDPQGQYYTLNYEPGTAKITSIADPLGQLTTFTYGLPSDPFKITRVTDPFGRAANFTYDAQGRLASITDPAGIVSSFTYQGSTDFINSMTTPYGTTTFESGAGVGTRFIQATDPLGQTERVEYHAQLPTSVIPASEAVIPAGVAVSNANLNLYNSFYWDKQAYAAAQAFAPGSAQYFAQATLSHWALGPRGVTGFATSTKKPLENRVWHLFQNQSNPDYVDPSGTALAAITARVLDDGSTQIHRRTYDRHGQVIQEIDPLGRQTDYIYGPDTDPWRWTNTTINLRQVTQKNGASNETLFSATYNIFNFDQRFLALTTTDAAGQTTSYSYNSFGQPLTITNPKGEVTTMAYNPQGYLQSVTGALPGSTTTFTYDAAGRVRTVTDSEGYVVTNDYDNLDRLTKQTFPDGTFRQTVYDRLSVGSVRDRLGRTINQTWCRCGSLKTLQDGNGITTTWNYDVQGRLISKVYADGKGDTFLYETSTSRLKSKTDALGQTITYAYNRDNNLASISYTNPRNPTPNVSFIYDPVYNQRTSMTDGTGTTTYSYYPVNATVGAGRLQSVAGPLANSTITYTYDQLGRVVGRSINGAANQMSMVYDALGRVTSETNPLGNFTTAYVNTTGRPSSLTYPNGQTTVYAYFNNVGDQRLAQIRNTGPGSVNLSTFNYSYDAEGQIQSWGQTLGAAPAGAYTLGYDLAGQLTSAALSGATPKNFAYNYDPAGNRTNETINAAAAPATLNALNQLVSRTGANPRAFAYDSNGNMISNNGVGRTATNYSYLWDAENRLVAILYPTTNQRTDFAYDGLGRRIRITERTGATITSVRQFVWDGLSIAEERDGVGSLTKRFFSQGQMNGATALFYARDHLGSVREVANSAGSLQARYDYDPYGRRTLTAGAEVADFGFTGHFYHAQSKLHLAPYRGYDADQGRWINRDPIGERGGLNVFSYVYNSVSFLVDNLGYEATLTFSDGSSAVTDTASGFERIVSAAGPGSITRIEISGHANSSMQHLRSNRDWREGVDSTFAGLNKLFPSLKSDYIGLQDDKAVLVDVQRGSTTELASVLSGKLSKNAVFSSMGCETTRRKRNFLQALSKSLPEITVEGSPDTVDHGKRAATTRYRGGKDIE
jgi:RHS repeat-associated protein